ncbi:MAG: hypothetical protein HC890_03440 [Chloroflexaceae bacterium]|nr:hypothetical protein [Chloroflexaceae bacterium]
MVRLSALAVRVERFGQRADFRLPGFGGFGEREGIEAAGFVVNGSILQRSPGREGVGYVDATAEDAQHKGIVQGGDDQAMLGLDPGVEKLKHAMLGRLDGRDVAPQAFDRAAQLLVAAPEKPPERRSRASRLCRRSGFTVASRCS